MDCSLRWSQSWFSSRPLSSADGSSILPIVEAKSLRVVLNASFLSCPTSSQPAFVSSLHSKYIQIPLLLPTSPSQYHSPSHHPQWYMISSLLTGPSCCPCLSPGVYTSCSSPSLSPLLWLHPHNHGRGAEDLVLGSNSALVTSLCSATATDVITTNNSRCG